MYVLPHARRAVSYIQATGRRLWQPASCMARRVIYARNVTYVRPSLARMSEAKFRVGTLNSPQAAYGKVGRAVIYVIYARQVTYEAAVARTASSASGVSTSSSAAVSVGTSTTASW